MPSAWRPTFRTRLVVTALVLLCAGLFFALARRRVGDLLAVPPTVLLLFFGSGWETVITPVRIPSLIAVAAGLGALIALEKRDRRGDIVAATLLTASVASHPVGLSFLAAAGVLVVFRPWPQPWRSAWLLAVPAAVFGAWWLFLRAPSTDAVFPTRPIDVVHFAVDSWTSITAAVSGLAGILDEPTFDQTVAQIAAAALFASLRRPPGDAARSRPGELLGRPGGAGRAGRIHPSIPRRVPALARGGQVPLSGGRSLPAPAGRRWRVPPGCAAGRRWRSRGVLALGLVYNVDRLRDGGATARLDSQRALAQYTVYEMAGPSLREDFKPSEFAATAGEYADAAARYGSVTEPVAEIAAAAPLVREAADDALAGSFGLALRPAQGLGSAGPRPPRVVQELGGASGPGARGASACSPATWPPGWRPPACR